VVHTMLQLQKLLLSQACVEGLEEGPVGPHHVKRQDRVSSYRYLGALCLLRHAIALGMGRIEKNE